MAASRDFQSRSIFDFCNSIGAKRTFIGSEASELRNRGVGPRVYLKWRAASQSRRFISASTINSNLFGSPVRLDYFLREFSGTDGIKRKHCIFGIHNFNSVGHPGRAALLQARLNEHRRSEV
jgi:hypothetical protein